MKGSDSYTRILHSNEKYSNRMSKCNSVIIKMYRCINGWNETVGIILQTM